MSPFCHIEILFLVKILWKDDPDCNLAIRQFLVWISVVIQDVERELAAERASSREAVGQSWLYSCCGFLEGKICRCSAAEHRHNSSWDSWRTSCCLRISNCEYCFYGALQKFSSKSCRRFCFLEFWGIYRHCNWWGSLLSQNLRLQVAEAAQLHVAAQDNFNSWASDFVLVPRKSIGWWMNHHFCRGLSSESKRKHHQKRLPRLTSTCNSCFVSIKWGDAKEEAGVAMRGWTTSHKFSQ